MNLLRRFSPEHQAATTMAPSDSPEHDRDGSGANRRSVLKWLGLVPVAAPIVLKGAELAAAEEAPTTVASAPPALRALSAFAPGRVMPDGSHRGMQIILRSSPFTDAGFVDASGALACAVEDGGSVIARLFVVDLTNGESIRGDYLGAGGQGPQATVLAVPRIVASLDRAHCYCLLVCAESRGRADYFDAFIFAPHDGRIA